MDGLDSLSPRRGGWQRPGMADGAGSSAGTAAAGTIPSVADHVLLRRIGAGAYGEVWVAIDRNTGAYCQTPPRKH